MFRGMTVQGDPITNWPKVHKECAKYGVFGIEVVDLTTNERTITDAQRKWYYCKNGPVKHMSQYMGVSRKMADVILKVKCGEEWLIAVVDGEKHILSKTTLTAEETNSWFENIWDFMEKINCPVPKPDPEWRKNERKDNE